MIYFTYAIDNYFELQLIQIFPLQDKTQRWMNSDRTTPVLRMIVDQGKNTHGIIKRFNVLPAVKYRPEYHILRYTNHLEISDQPLISTFGLDFGNKCLKLNKVSLNFKFWTR